MWSIHPKEQANLENPLYPPKEDEFSEHLAASYDLFPTYEFNLRWHKKQVSLYTL